MSPGAVTAAPPGRGSQVWPLPRGQSAAGAGTACVDGPALHAGGTVFVQIPTLRSLQSHVQFVAGGGRRAQHTVPLPQGWHRDSARPLRGLDVGRHSRDAGVPVCTGPPVLSRPRGLPPLETARLCSVAVTLSL